MARCKLTNMNLRNIRKSREYQCLLIDLVKTGVVGKSAAEGLLGYTIPTGLLGDTTPVTPSDDEEEPRMITIVAADTGSFNYDLNNGDTVEDVLDAVNSHWTNGDSNGMLFNTIRNLVPDQEGEISVDNVTYYTAGKQADSFEAGMIVLVTYEQPAGDSEEG